MRCKLCIKNNSEYCHIHINTNKHKKKSIKTQKKSNQAQKKSDQAQKKSINTQKMSTDTQKMSTDTQKKTQKKSTKTQKKSIKTQKKSIKTQKNSIKTQKMSNKTLKKTQKKSIQTRKKTPIIRKILFHNYTDIIRNMTSLCFPHENQAQMGLENPNLHWFGAFYIKELVGVAVVLEGKIYNVCVHKDHRRQGVGNYLIKHIVKDICKKQKFVSLDVLNDNTSAVKLYTKLGFVKSGTLAHVDAISMKKKCL
jgi:GNAT superfamily N-acetyltransferase